MAKVKLYSFTVTGSGSFPIDMLRYDRCWPKTEHSDSGQIADSHSPGYREGVYNITLIGLNEPTSRRWHSFGWKVDDRTVSTVEM